MKFTDVKVCEASSRDLIAYGIQMLYLESLEPRISPSGIKVLRIVINARETGRPCHDAMLSISMSDVHVWGMLRGEQWRAGKQYTYETPKMDARVPCSKIFDACMDLFSHTTEPDAAVWVAGDMCIIRNSTCLTTDMSPREWASKFHRVCGDTWGNGNRSLYNKDCLFEETIDFSVDIQNKPISSQMPPLYSVNVRGDETKVSSSRRDWGKRQPLVARLWHFYTLHGGRWATKTYLDKHNAFMRAIREELLGKTRHMLDM